jgi:peptidoglycan/LPS O-acetylase OafA/YrhL
MNNTINQNKDIYWINALKAFSIIGVYFVHCQLYYLRDVLSINQWIYPWYVNAFFFISGYLLFWKQLSEPKILEDRKFYVLKGSGKTLFLNILYRIIIPSIIFSAIEFVPSCLIQGREMKLGYALYKIFGGTTYWFTSALVVAELILFLLFCTRRRNIWFYTAICFVLAIVGMVIVKMGILKGGIWLWRHGLISLAFLALGGLYWRYEKQVDKLMKWWFVLPLLAVYIIVILYCDNTNPLISTLQIQPLGFFTSAVACLLLAWLCKWFPKLKLLTFIGQNSLGFYFLSGALPIPLGLVMNKSFAAMGLQFTNLQTMLVLFVMWLICIALAYLAVIIINRWLSWLWDLRKLKKT